MNNVIPKESCGGTKLRLLLCGDESRREFFAVTESLTAMEHEGSFEMTLCHEPKAFFQTVSTRQDAYDIVVVLQEYSGQYTKSFYEHIRKKAPLSAMVIILGSLCEGEGRTGSPVIGAIRYYWHQWKSFGVPQIKTFVERKTGRFSLPVLALDENLPENWPLEHGIGDSAHSHTSTMSNSKKSFCETTVQQRVYIIAEEDRAMSQLLCNIYQKRKQGVFVGTYSDLFESKEEWDRIVVDSVDLNRDDFYQKIRRVAHLFPLASIDILAFSPRVEEVERFREFPNCLVFSKPF